MTLNNSSVSLQQLKTYIKTLQDNWPPPAGYSDYYGGPNDLEYFADPKFGIPYQPLRNSGQNLDINLHKSHWYVFVK